jgi:hypothetical protein
MTGLPPKIYALHFADQLLRFWCSYTQKTARGASYGSEEIGQEGIGQLGQNKKA